MAALKDYDPQLHDLYLYEPKASLNRQTGEKIEGIPVRYNPKCFVDRLQDYPLDLTGVAVLPRRHNNKVSRNGAVNYGWEEEWDADQVSENANINFYNSGYFAMTLISPKHVGACEHFWITAQNQLNKVVTFMNKQGEKFETTFIPPPPENIFGDNVILELTDEVPADFGIRIYNKVPVQPYSPSQSSQTDFHEEYPDFIGYAGWKPNTIIFTKTPQGAIFQRATKKLRDLNGNIIGDGEFGSSSDFLVSDKVSKGWISGVWSGDSGSPAFIVSKQHGTLFVRAFNGGGVGTAYKNPDGTIAKSATFKFIQGILKPFGYEYEAIEVFDAVTSQIQQRGSREDFETIGGLEGYKVYCDVKITGKDNTIVEKSSDIAFSTITGVTPDIRSIIIPTSIAGLGVTHTNEGLDAFLQINDNSRSYPQSETTVTWTIDDEEYNDLEDTLDNTFRIPDNTAGKTLKATVRLDNSLGSDSESITYGEIEPRGYTASLTNPTFTPNPPVRGQSCTFNASIDDGEPAGGIWNWAIYSLDKNSAPSVKLAGPELPEFFNYPMSSAFPVTFTVPDSDIPVGNRLVLIGSIRNPYDKEGKRLEIYSDDVVED